MFSTDSVCSEVETEENIENFRKCIYEKKQKISKVFRVVFEVEFKNE